MTNSEFRKEILTELNAILNYWELNTLDKEASGFVGRIDSQGSVDYTAPKGIILNTRILWTCARAEGFYKSKKYEVYCHKAYDYLTKFFKDTEYGGLFWEVSASGKPMVKKKQIYAQAFGIYALSEYYKLTKKEEILDWALELFHLIENHANEPTHGGYLEAFTQSWGPIADLRLSEKDHNEPKTANTHLHILEAYTTLYQVSKNKKVENKLRNLFHLFFDTILNDRTNHLGLFFNLEWQETSGEISYGHDIETGWLLLHAARIIGDSQLISKAEQGMVAIADTFLNEAVDDDFGVYNNKTKDSGLDTDKHWWPQAEAMVGLVYTWELTKKPIYLESAKKIWIFIKENILDLKNGEWFFRVDKVGKPYMQENKVGPWKCPYHNGRAMIEIANLLA